MMVLTKHTFQKHDVAHTIYECEGAQNLCHRAEELFKKCRIYRSTSRICCCSEGLEMRRAYPYMHMWARRHGTKFNGAPYIVQRAGEAVYSEAGKAQLKEQVAYYMKNASSHQKRT